MKSKNTNYHSYLQLDRLLSSQERMSAVAGAPAHDEWLFIITHQAYELWFKQILIELDSILEIFASPSVAETHMGTVVSRLERIAEIQKVLIDQIQILETMTPLDFLDFRDHLYPASGFQSVQFRMVENKLGLREEQRLTYNQAPYHSQLPKDHHAAVQGASQGPTLFSCVESWLERIPFLKDRSFDFWQKYQEAVLSSFAQEKEVVSRNTQLSSEDQKRNQTIIEQSLKTFSALFDPKSYEDLRLANQWRFSYSALHGALFIQLYRDQPVLHLPFRLLTAILDIDEFMTSWRHRHALMVRRMLGTKLGTGGSSGTKYLLETSERHRVFGDLLQLTTFFIPRSKLPELPREFKTRLGFWYEGQ